MRTNRVNNQLIQQSSQNSLFFVPFSNTRQIVILDVRVL